MNIYIYSHLIYSQRIPLFTPLFQIHLHFRVIHLMNPLKGLSVITPLVSLFIQQSPPPPLHTHTFHTPFTRTRSPAITHSPINLTSQGINDNPVLSLSLSHERTQQKSAKKDKYSPTSLPPLSHLPPRPGSLNRPLTRTEPLKISFGEETKSLRGPKRQSKKGARE